MMFVLLVRIAFVVGVTMVASIGSNVVVLMLASRGVLVMMRRFFVNVMSATTGHGVPKHRKHGQNGCGGSHVEFPQLPKYMRSIIPSESRQGNRTHYLAYPPKQA